MDGSGSSVVEVEGGVTVVVCGWSLCGSDVQLTAAAAPAGDGVACLVLGVVWLESVGLAFLWGVECAGGERSGGRLEKMRA